MVTTPSILAVILARGGSKGFPGKNIAPLRGKPLLAHSIEAARSCSAITRTVVSSDDESILTVARTFGADALRRPAEYASDTATSESALRHAVEACQADGAHYDYTVLLQPTSPLRTAHHLTEALDRLRSSKATALISVYEPEHTPLKAFTEDSDGYLHGLIDDRTPFMRRQDLPRVYMPNGAIYVIKTDVFLATGRLFTDQTIPYLMSRDESMDIDRREDLVQAEQFLAQHSHD